MLRERSVYIYILLLSIFFLFFSLYGTSYAAGETIGSVAENINDSFDNLAKLLMGIATIAGIGFSISAIFKFKQHKDNPTQIPVGTPIALVLVGAALIFLPSLIGSTAVTIFSDPIQANTTDDFLLLND